MAELRLYSNPTAPQLPLEMVLPSLSWLPTEVAKYSTESMLSFAVIINIILVFAGARTSALLFNLTTDFHPFINRLNDALYASNQSSFRLTVDQSYMDDWVFRENSPRFIRSHCLTPREVGQNLDMFSPGNLNEISEDDKRFSIHIYEMETLTQVTAETILTSCLGLEDEQRLSEFTESKVQLFNHVFRVLGLEYQFEWFVRLLPRDEECVMSSNTAPSREWWAKHWPDIAFNSVGPRSHLRNIFEHHERHWPLITILWQFHRSNRFWIAHDVDFRIRVEGIFNATSNHIAKSISIEYDNLRLKLAKLDAERRVKSGGFKEGKHGQRLWAWKYLKGIVGAELCHWLPARRSSPSAIAFRGLDCPALQGHSCLIVARQVADLVWVILFG